MKTTLAITLLSVSLPLFASATDKGIYLGFTHSALHAEKWNVENANPGAQFFRLGYQPVSWASIEYRESIHTSADARIDHGLTMQSSNVRGAYLRLRHPSFAWYFLVGKTDTTVDITVPDYVDDPGLIQELIDSLFPGQAVPEELRNMEPGVYEIDIKDKPSYGVGVDIPGDGQWNKWNFQLEYIRIERESGWEWSLYSLGFTRHF